MAKETITIALIQTTVDEDIDANLKKTANLVAEAAEKNARIVCLQELFATRYFAQTENEENFKFAEEIPGKTSTFLSGLAKQHGIALVGGSFYELGDDGNRYNTCLILDEEGNVAAKYRKIHIPHDPLYWEKFYFAPGNLGYVQTRLEDITIAPLICYDQWFPEPARINAIHGAQVIFYPTAVGWFSQMQQDEPWSADRWEHAICAHASMNGIYVAAVNRTGVEDELTFWGRSFIADPFGEIVVKAPETEEAVLVVDLDLNKIFQSQDGWMFLKNRRPDTYDDLVRGE